jgi:cbb3-type cytochrome oxidase subunit 3
MPIFIVRAIALYTLYRVTLLALDLFSKSRGGVNMESVSTFALTALCLGVLAYLYLKDGLSGSAAQIGRFVLGVLSFLAALGGGFTFLFIAAGALDVAPFGKEAWGFLALCLLGIAGVAIILKKENDAAPGK